MNILIVHQHFRYPEEGGPIRSWYLGQALLKRGHKVTIISRKNIGKTRVKNINGLEVHYLPVEYYNKMSFPRRIISYLSFVSKGKQYLKKLNVEKVDLVYCISTPLTTGLIGLYVKKHLNTPFVFEVGDLWPDAPIQMNALKDPLSKFVARHLERKIYDNANGVVGLSPSIENKIRERTHTQVHYVPNFSDLEYFKSVQVPRTHPFIITYAGAFGRANGLESIIDVAILCLKHDLKVKFQLMGQGATYDTLRKTAEDKGLTNISFLPFGNKKSVRDALQNSHAAIISYKKLSILETGSPNKFFDALAVGRMTILNFGGWLKEYVKDYDCGFSYDPENPENFIKQIRPYLEDNGKAVESGKNALRLANDKFALTDWERNFTEVIEQCK